MSGVFGIVDSRQLLDVRVTVNKMGSVMSHRDWFVAESMIDDEYNVAIGRIGIGVFNKAHQPVWNTSRTVALVMAGELYNRDRLDGNNVSESDEQLALALYESKGEQFVSYLSGAFVIAIFDKLLNRLLIVNDRYGLYPLFYACYNKRLIFAPEVKGILCDGNFPRKLDLTALAQIVRFQQLLGERTFFEDIQLLPGASILIFSLSNGSCSLKSYWSFNDIPYRTDIGFEDAVVEAGRLFKDVVQRMSSDSHRHGVYLSGGLDSRSIIGMIKRQPVISLTYGAKNCRDVYYAEKIAKAVSSDHYWFDFPDGKWVEDYVDFHLELTEGFHSWIHAHGISTLSQARELIDVNLTGWSDGSIKGIPNIMEPLQISAVDDMAFMTRVFKKTNQDYTWPSITEVEENFLYAEPLQKKMQGLAFDSFRTELSRYLDYRPDVRGEYYFSNEHCRRLTQNFVVFTRSHVEVRAPFYDYELFDFIYSLPVEMRMNQKLFRHIIQREMPRLAYIPYDRDQFLPTTQSFVRGVHAGMVKLKYRINRHVKKIFIERHPLYADYESYLRNELRNWAENILYDRRTAERGIFNPLFLHTLMQRHFSGLEEWTIGKIAPLITYEMMLRRYYD